MKGFTLAETLISVLILGMVAVASLKLITISERGLSQVRIKEALLKEANRYMIELTIDPTNSFGISDDVEWNVEEKEANLWFDAADALKGLNLFSEEEISADLGRFSEQEQRWRELEVKKNGQSIKLFLPFSELAYASSQDILKSGDDGDG
jgi:prepilin-type N-terminal cleavage/methylation domain-containing protein